MTERRKTCLQCDAPIEQTKGRRERKFCVGGKCASAYWLATHPKKTRFKRIPIEEYEELKKKVEINNLPENKERILKERSGATQAKANNPLTIDESIPSTTEQTIEVPEKVAEYEKELRSIEGKTSSIANQRRKWLNNQILKLKL